MKSVATILREMDQIKRADIDPQMKANFLEQKRRELDAINQMIASPAPPPAAPPAADETPKPPSKTR